MFNINTPRLSAEAKKRIEVLAAKLQQLVMKECAGYNVAIVLKDKKSNWGEVVCTCDDGEAKILLSGALRHIKLGRPEIEPDPDAYE